MNTASTTGVDTVAIFGGSGATGQVLIRQASGRGIKVRALVRNVNSVSFGSDRVELLEGSLSSLDDVTSCLTGCGAVICVFGPRPPYADIFCEDATSTIVTAMQKLGIRRLVCQTGGMIGEYPANRTPPFQLMSDMFKRRSPQVANDRVGQESVVMHSGLAWTIVKPPKLTDGKAKGKWLVGPDVRVGLLSSISRNDLAYFLAAETLIPQHIGQAVFIRS